MHILPISFKDNPLYPLPSDYETLTGRGQRMARINACRQYLLKGGTPRERGDRFVSCVNFFDLYYLHPDIEAGFDPFFYDDYPLKSPQMHDDILHRWGAYPMNISIAPRGSAKSSVCRKAAILRLLARPAYRLVYATSSHDNAEETGQIIRDQCYNNERVFNDWGPEYGGSLKPRKGDAPQAIKFFALTNASRIQIRSVQSKIRGLRPLRFILDDPEYDEKTSTDMGMLFDDMERFLFKIMMPMIMREGAGADWLATFISKRHFAWYAMETQESPKGPVPLDARFHGWSRLKIKAAYEDEKGKITSCWREMWPPDREYKKKHPELAGRVSLEEIKERIGTAHWLSEYMASPGTAESSSFGALSEEKHGWEIIHIDPDWDKDPRNSDTVIKWSQPGDHVGEFVEKEMTMKAFLARGRLFQTIDTSHTHHKGSDFKVCCLMCLQPNNILFIIDLWAEQANQAKLIRNTFRMADRWRCPQIWPEVVRQSFALYYDLLAHVRTRAVQDVGFSHVPAIKPLKIGFAAKNEKVATLTTRFEFGLIKFPLFLKHEQPWRMLFDQIEQANLDRADLGLRKDDCIDAVAMSTPIIGTRLREEAVGEPETRDVIKLLSQGITTIDGGTEVLHACNIHEIPLSLLDAVISNNPKPQRKGTRV